MNNRITSPLLPPNVGAAPKTQEAPFRTGQPLDTSQYRPPHKAKPGSIPSPEWLDGMVAKGLDARNKGVYWDRGSIPNIVV